MAARPARIYVGLLGAAVPLLAGSTLLSTVPALAQTNCVTTGSVASVQCGPLDIQMVGGSGASTLTVSNTIANSVAVLSDPFVTGPFTQTLTIDGITTLNRADYPAVYMYSAQAGWTAELFIGEDVSITSAGPFGAVWLRSESNDTATSNAIRVDSAATINSLGANSDGITATSNNGPVSITNRGVVTAVGGRGLYADGGSASLTPVTVEVTNLGSALATQAGIRVINYNGTATIDNQGLVRSATRQGLIAWSANGGAEITNSGSVLADHYNAIVAVGTGGDVTVSNSGSVTAQRNPSLVQVSPNFHGIDAYTDGAGNVTVTNLASGTIVAAADAGASATTASGTATLRNAGTIDARIGLLANASNGQVDVENKGTLTTSQSGIAVTAATGGTVVNRGIINSTASAFQSSAGVTLNMENAAGAKATGSLQLSAATSLLNAGTLSLRHGANFVSPGGSGTIVASTIGGDFVQTSTGTLDILVNDATMFSTLTVGGLATLAGTINLDIRPGYAGGTLAGVITTGTGILDNGITVSDTLLRYNFTPVLNGNALDIVVTDTGLTTIAAATAMQRRSATSRAEALDTILAAGTTSPELSRLLGLITQSATASEVAAIVAETGTLFDGQLLGAIADMYGRFGPASRPGTDDAGQGVWIRPFVSGTQQNSGDERVGYDGAATGFSAGAYGQLAAGSELGFAFALADMNFSGAAETASVRLYEVSLHGRHALDQASDVLFDLGAGKVHVSGERTISALGLVAGSDIDGILTHAGIAIDRDFALGPVTQFTPVLRLDYSRIATGGYSETGAGGVGLIVGDQAWDALVLSLDGTLRHAVTDMVSLEGTLGVSYDLHQGFSGGEAAFSGAPQTPFSTQGSARSPFEVRAGLAAAIDTPAGFEARGSLDLSYRDGTFGQSVQLTLGGRF